MIKLKSLLTEESVIKNKKTGNVYVVKNFDPSKHDKPTPAEIEKAKQANNGQVPKGEPQPKQTPQNTAPTKSGQKLGGSDFTSSAEKKSDGMATVNAIAAGTGLRPQAVAGWADENGINLSKVAADLKSKKLKPMDLMTAVSGNPGNKYAKQIIDKYSQNQSANITQSKLSPKKIKDDLADLEGTKAMDVANAIKRGDADPQKSLGLGDSQYDNLLKRLARIGGESEHEAKFRTNNFSTAELENWAKERLDVVSKYSQNQTRQSNAMPKLKELMPGIDTSSKPLSQVSSVERQQISTIIDKLAELGNRAKQSGEKAPNYNLCQVSIPGTNLYCDGNKGIERADMPQFKGTPQPGSPADKLPKDNNGEADTEEFFKEMLNKKGIKVSNPVAVPPDRLKATQSELVGVKVAGMSKVLDDKNHPAYGKITAPIYVSNDGYVLDGHHRWAAVVAHNAANPKNQIPMNVRVIDEPIIPLVKRSNSFAEKMGIRAKAADTGAKG